MINLPIFRAKKTDSDEYVSGYLKFTKYNNRTEYVINYVYDSSSVFGECEIDPSTLSIHFPDRLDSQGNKIFASLQEDGKGGDICESKWFNTDVRLTVETESVRYSNGTMIQDGYNISRYDYKKIIGIQQ